MLCNALIKWVFKPLVKKDSIFYDRTLSNESLGGELGFYEYDFGDGYLKYRDLIKLESNFSNYIIGNLCCKIWIKKTNSCFNISIGLYKFKLNKESVENYMTLCKKHPEYMINYNTFFYSCKSELENQTIIISPVSDMNTAKQATKEIENVFAKQMEYNNNIIKELELMDVHKLIKEEIRLKELFEKAKDNYTNYHEKTLKVVSKHLDIYTENL